MYDCCATLGLRSATASFQKPQYQTLGEPADDWFHLRKSSFQGAIRERDIAQTAFNKAQKPGAPKPIKELSMLQASRKAVKREVKKAKCEWLARVVSDLEGRDNPSGYWERVRKIRGGLRGHVKKHNVLRFRNSEGKVSDSAAENAKALETHFENVYNTQSGVD